MGYESTADRNTTNLLDCFTNPTTVYGQGANVAVVNMSTI